VPDCVDHRHDHEAEADRDSDVAERVCLGVDHDRPGAGEDERERPDQFGDERTLKRPVSQRTTPRIQAESRGCAGGSTRPFTTLS
jgi:hypothetical protein